MSYAELPGHLVQDACTKTVADVRSLDSHPQGRKAVRAQIGRLALLAAAASRSGKDVHVSEQDMTLIAQHYLGIDPEEADPSV